MKFISDFFRAIGNCFKSFELLFKKGFWHYLLYQFGIWLLLWVLSVYSLFTLADRITTWVEPYLTIDNLPFVASALGFMVAGILKIFFWFISGIFTKYILLIALSPILALLSEKTEEHLTGAKFGFSWAQLMKDVVRGILISLRNMLLEYTIMFVCFFLSLIFPPLSVVTTPFVFLVGWYFTGFTLLDYNSERRRLGLRESVRLIRGNKGYACGTGLFYSFFLALPFTLGSFIGLMLGPGLAVIGGTRSFLEFTKKTDSSAKENLA